MVPKEEFTSENHVEKHMNVDQWEDKFRSDNQVENDKNVDVGKQQGVADPPELPLVPEPDLLPRVDHHLCHLP